MNRQNRTSRVARLVVATIIGGSAFQLSGCDPAVRSTLLAGLETTTTSLSTALISAFFVSLRDDTTTGTTTLPTQ
ncbi:MAG: hypothetical protein ACE5E6_00225 [Phycisphaerae bacterium]